MAVRKLALLASVLTAVGASLIPATPAQASSAACSDTALPGAFYVSCGMSGTCPTVGQYCVLSVSCHLSFVGLGAGDCGSSGMACGLTGPCTGGDAVVLPPGTRWSVSCGGGGTSLTPVTLQCAAG